MTWGCFESRIQSLYSNEAHHKDHSLCWVGWAQSHSLYHYSFNAGTPSRAVWTHTELIISVLYDFFAFCDRFRNFCRHLTGRAGWEVGEKKRNWPNTDSLETWRLSHRSAITSFPALILIALSLSSSSLSSLTQSFILATLPSFIVQSQRSLPCSLPSSQVLKSLC